MMFISWLVLGLIAGMIAKAVVGGGGGWLITILLGVLGAVVGGWLSSLLFHVSLGGFWNFRLINITIRATGAGVSEHYWK